GPHRHVRDVVFTLVARHRGSLDSRLYILHRDGDAGNYRAVRIPDSTKDRSHHGLTIDRATIGQHEKAQRCNCHKLSSFSHLFGPPSLLSLVSGPSRPRSRYRCFRTRAEMIMRTSSGGTYMSPLESDISGFHVIGTRTELTCRA